jgi:predicted alpha/beta-hydrolase family hydrolase
MVHLRDGLSVGGYPVLTFNYPYAEEGRRRPDPPKTTLACHYAAARRLRTYCRSVVFAGKSMGGRLGSHVVADGEPAAGLIYYGYPLVAPGKREVRSVDHLGEIDVPQLFFAGTRDPLCPLDLLFPTVESLPMASTSIIEGGDHSFKTPRDLGREWPDVLDDIVELSLEWLGKL